MVIHIDYRTSIFDNKEIDLFYEWVIKTVEPDYLGQHIIEKLMGDTSLTVHCLIRDEAKFMQVLEYYHGDRFLNEVGKRIIPVIGDIRKSKLGLNEDLYSELIEKVDDVIHCAAIVKHFGNWEESKVTNYLGTLNVIEFAKAGNYKLEYISTMYVSGELLVKQKKGNVVFNEDMLYVGQEYKNNIYVYSKYLAECAVIQAIREGLKANIYRIGNLTWRHKDGLFQNNKYDNWLYSINSAILEVGVLTDIFSNYHVSLSPVDNCAEAIVNLVKSTTNTIYNLYNNNVLSFGEFIKPLGNVDILSYEEFMKRLQVEKGNNDALVILYAYSSLYKSDFNQYVLEAQCKKTCNKLNSMGFKWPEIDLEYIKCFKAVQSQYLKFRYYGRF